MVNCWGHLSALSRSTKILVGGIGVQFFSDKFGDGTGIAPGNTQEFSQGSKFSVAHQFHPVFNGFLDLFWNLHRIRKLL